MWTLDMRVLTHIHSDQNVLTLVDNGMSYFRLHSKIVLDMRRETQETLKKKKINENDGRV